MRERVGQIILSAVALLLIASAFATRPDGDSDPAAIRFLAFFDQQASVWFSVLAVFAFILGGANLMRTHWRKVRDRARDWRYSLVTLASFVIVLVVGLAKLGGPPGLQGNVAASDGWLTAIFETVLSPLHATLYALLAFYIASASFRTFRARNLEATILLVSALIVIMGRIPFGATLTSWLPEPFAFLRMEDLSLWILKVPNTAGQRAIMIGIALGVVAMAMRLILGVEKGQGGRSRR
ncbi:hypothetical protein H8E07_20065 [bacterium]|nr:hypothetical protein [bacterium]